MNNIYVNTNEYTFDSSTHDEICRSPDEEISFPTFTLKYNITGNVELFTHVNASTYFLITSFFSLELVLLPWDLTNKTSPQGEIYRSQSN